MLKLDERQLKAAHSRANLRRLLDHVTAGHADKVSKLLAKGLDPNFHCGETGGKSAALGSDGTDTTLQVGVVHTIHSHFFPAGVFVSFRTSIMFGFHRRMGRPGQPAEVSCTGLRPTER